MTLLNKALKNIVGDTDKTVTGDVRQDEEGSNSIYIKSIYEVLGVCACDEADEQGRASYPYDNASMR